MTNVWSAVAEMVYIIPHPIILFGMEHLIAVVRTISTSKSIPIAPYVDFMRMEMNIVDILSCDWCSIVNGTFEWVTTVLLKEIELNGLVYLQHIRIPWSIRVCVYGINILSVK